jgi:hypothetical protein
VPAGEHVVEFDYSGLPQRRAGMIFSFVSLALAASILFVGKGQSPARRQEASVRMN